MRALPGEGVRALLRKLEEQCLRRAADVRVGGVGVLLADGTPDRAGGGVSPQRYQRDQGDEEQHGERDPDRPLADRVAVGHFAAVGAPASGSGRRAGRAVLTRATEGLGAAAR